MRPSLPASMSMRVAVAAPLFWEVCTADGQTSRGWAAVVTVLEHAPAVGSLVSRLPLRKLAPLADLIEQLQRE